MPYMQCLWLGSNRGSVRCNRMNFTILCSPSPGTEASEKITLIRFHAGSVAILEWIHSRSLCWSLSMNGVPGVMTL